MRRSFDSRRWMPLGVIALATILGGCVAYPDYGYSGYFGGGPYYSGGVVAFGGDGGGWRGGGHHHRHHHRRHWRN